jgi:uncharacterized protein YecE (DUF72 family)
VGKVMVGTAGWSIPPRHAACFPEQGSHLERYSQRFAAVEINSSFLVLSTLSFFSSSSSTTT